MQQEEGKTQASRAVLPQVLMSFMVCLTGMSYGMSSGHSAVLLPHLQSENSSLPIDTETGSWIASVYAISSPVGCLLGGLAMDMWGRRLMNVVGNIGMVAGWLLIVVAQNPSMLIYGRIVEGLSRSIFATCMSVFVDEVVDPKLRGVIIGNMFTAVPLGVMAISSLGAFVDWRMASALAAVPSAINVISLYFVYESPTWLVKRNRMEEAVRTLLWLWGPGKEEQDQWLKAGSLSKQSTTTITVTGVTEVVSKSQRFTSPSSIGGSSTEESSRIWKCSVSCLSLGFT